MQCAVIFLFVLLSSNVLLIIITKKKKLLIRKTTFITKTLSFTINFLLRHSYPNWETITLSHSKLFTLYTNSMCMSAYSYICILMMWNLNKAGSSDLPSARIQPPESCMWFKGTPSIESISLGYTLMGVPIVCVCVLLSGYQQCIYKHKLMWQKQFNKEILQ